jgi:hypothetical protein
LLEENAVTRKELARDLLLQCPPDSFPDYQAIADALEKGDSKEAILFMPEAFRWPKTYKWLKERL